MKSACCVHLANWYGGMTISPSLLRSNRAVKLGNFGFRTSDRGDVDSCCLCDEFASKFLYIAGKRDRDGHGNQSTTSKTDNYIELISLFSNTHYPKWLPVYLLLKFVLWKTIFEAHMLSCSTNANDYARALRITCVGYSRFTSYLIVNNCVKVISRSDSNSIADELIMCKTESMKIFTIFLPNGSHHKYENIENLWKAEHRQCMYVIFQAQKLQRWCGVRVLCVLSYFVVVDT